VLLGNPTVRVQGDRVTHLVFPWCADQYAAPPGSKTSGCRSTVGPMTKPSTTSPPSRSGPTARPTAPPVAPTPHCVGATVVSGEPDESTCPNRTIVVRI
jgi:hypothetical protein